MEVKMIELARTGTIVGRERGDQMKTAAAQIEGASVMFHLRAPIQNEPQTGKGAHDPLKIPPAPGGGALYGQHL